MSSSRSDGVTQFVRPSVLPFFRPFFLLVSLEAVVFQGSFRGVSRMFQGCFKEVSRKFQGRLKKVSRVFQGSFKGVSRKFPELQIVAAPGHLVPSRFRDHQKDLESIPRTFLRE